MFAQILEKDDEYVLNHCTKYLARDNTEPLHNFGQYTSGDDRASICEAWRFPIIDGYSDGINFDQGYLFNRVTFVYYQESFKPQHVGVVGTFANLYKPIPLEPVLFEGMETGYYAVTIVVPKGEIHTYKFLIDNQITLDPINPQRAILEDGEVWSRFFTNLCTEPLCFERWEFIILDRLVDHILPFQTQEGENFLKRYVDHLTRQEKSVQYAYAYRLDQSVGVVNFIDNLLAKEESHRLIDYKICLQQIDRILRQQNLYVEPRQMPKEMYTDLYSEMANNNVNGWNYNQYTSPEFFLKLLRRHTFTGAFSHPKYGGNVGAVSWAFLEERYKDETGKTLFDWRRAIEKPLGVSSEYRG